MGVITKELLNWMDAHRPTGGEVWVISDAETIPKLLAIADRIERDHRLRMEDCRRETKRAAPRKGIHLCDPGNIADACAMFVDAVREGQVTHFAQGALTDSVTGCCKRLIGNSGGYGFGSGATGTDPTAAEAAERDEIERLVDSLNRHEGHNRKVESYYDGTFKVEDHGIKVDPKLLKNTQVCH